MNSTSVKNESLRPVMLAKLERIEVEYDRQIHELYTRAYRECSFFPMRRTHERAMEYLKTNFYHAHMTIEREAQGQISSIRGLLNLIKLSNTGTINLDEDTAMWLYGD